MTAVKRYVVFAGPDYYPSGGWGDFHSSHDDINEARDAKLAEEAEGHWANIIDLTTGKEAE